MTPAELDRLIASQRKPGSHGERNCPKCGRGYMAYTRVASSSAYSCQECSWLEWRDPPWPRREPAKT